QMVRDGSRYFGPYSSVAYAHALMDIIGTLFKLRNCKHKLSDEAIASGKFKVCINAHIDKCCAPCVAAVSHEDYDALIDSVAHLLNGGVGDIIRENRARMNEAAAELRFEDAQMYKERVELLQKHYSKSPIISQTQNDTDIFSVVGEGLDWFCNFMRIRKGSVIQSYNMELSARIEESEGDILSSFIGEMISKFGKLSREVIVPSLPSCNFEGVQFAVPLKGAKTELLALSRKNALAMKAERLKVEEKSDPQQHTERVLEAIRRDLGMTELPRHIECFDNSNIQGTNPVASCVVFRDARPSKKDYRRFKIKTVVGANDFASMKEVVNRRYSRMMAEGETLPQLVVIDGGKGQLRFALEALEELGIADRMRIVGLAKRFEEVVLPNDPYPLFLDKNSMTLKVLMQIRDEAHRFGITFHRSLRRKSLITTELKEIKGVGDKTADKLLSTFRSVVKIKSATLDDLTAVVGSRQARLVYEHFKK
ncbi:MAG: excinuclease ABC subunit C, partial [Bacteroidales bacterium]|nr:excinuclease ABC subunit C [Bacteroidales bacterium]